MTTTPAFTLYAAQLGSTFLDQIERQSYSAGIEEMIIRANGAVSPQFAAIAHQSPKIDLTTTNLVAGLSAGTGGWTASGSNPASFYWRQYVNLGTLSTGATATKLSMTQGLIVPTRLSADQKGAKLDISAIPVWDGTNLPFTATANQTPSGTAQVNNVFVAGPIALAGTELNGIQSIDIDFGNKPLLLGSNGIAFDNFGAIQIRQPSVTVKTTDLSALASIGTTAEGAAFSLYFVAVSAYGTRIAAATASHVKLTGTAAMIQIDSAEGGMDGAAMATIKITPIWDGTNDILAVNTASVIS